MMLCWKRQLKMISQWTPRLMTWRSWCFHLVNCHRKTGVSDEFLPPKFLFASHWTNKISVVFKHLINLQLAGIRRKYYLWGVFRPKRRSRLNISTANFIAQTSSTQNAALSYQPDEMEGANTGSSPGQNFMSPLSVLEGVNSGRPRDHFASPLSSCSNSIFTKDSPCHPLSRLNSMERECGRNLDTKNQDVEQHDKCRIQASDIYVSTQGNGLVDEFGHFLEPFQLKSCLSFATKG